MVTKAYSYVRFSSERQRLGDSVRRQVQLAKIWAEQHGIELDDCTYQDLGVSAYDRKNETARLGAFLTAVSNGKVPAGSYLLIENLDRLSRAGILPTIELIQQLTQADIRVVLLADDGRVIDKESVKDLTSILIAVISAARAHDESAQKSKRIRAARDTRRAKLADGTSERILTSVCSGWLTANKAKTGFEVIPAMVESVKKVFDLAIAGHGTVAIARMANIAKWPAPGKNTDWHASLVSRITKNRVVLGEYQPHIYRNGKRLPTGDPIIGYYPAIIDEPTFLQAQHAIAGRAKIPGRRDLTYKNVFFGILKCGSCGATLTRKNKTSSTQPGYHLWMCADRVRGLTKCKSISGLSKYRLDISLLTGMIQFEFGQLASQKRADALRGHISAMEADIDQKRTQVENIADSLTLNRSSALTKRLGILEDSIEDIQKQLKAARAELASVSHESNEREHDLALEEIVQNLDADTEPAIKFRSALAQRVRDAVRFIYVFQQESVAAIEWRSTDESEPTRQWLQLNPEAHMQAAISGLLKVPAPRERS